MIDSIMIDSIITEFDEDSEEWEVVSADEGGPTLDDVLDILMASE